MNAADLPVLRKGTNWNVVDDVIGLVRDRLGEFEHETFDRILVPADVLHYVKYNITTKVIYRDEYLRSTSSSKIQPGCI
jgi:hypothetical protein